MCPEIDRPLARYVDEQIAAQIALADRARAGRSHESSIRRASICAVSWNGGVFGNARCVR